jgi:hypothetical protein
MAKVLSNLKTDLDRKLDEPWFQPLPTVDVRLETTEEVRKNPLHPPILGDFRAGGYPQTPGRKYPAPLLQQSLMD